MYFSSLQIVGHTVAVIVAYLVNKQSGQNDLSPCSWYFVIFITDVTVGVFISYKLHQLFVKNLPSMGAPGDYGQQVDPETGALIRPPKCERFSRQISIWLFLCVIPARVFCGVLVNLFTGVLAVFARILAQIFKGHPDVELVFVLVAGPVVINSIQYIIQDMFLAQSSVTSTDSLDGGDTLDGINDIDLGSPRPPNGATSRRSSHPTSNSQGDIMYARVGRSGSDDQDNDGGSLRIYSEGDPFDTHFDSLSSSKNMGNHLHSSKQIQKGRKIYKGKNIDDTQARLDNDYPVEIESIATSASQNIYQDDSYNAASFQTSFQTKSISSANMENKSLHKDYEGL